jgi:hypothetical protein
MLPFARYISLFSLCTLAACGGGETNVSSTPTPVPAPSPNYDRFTNLTHNQQIAMTGVFATRTDSSTVTQSLRGPTYTFFKPFSTANLSVTYDAASNTYTVRDGSFTSHAFGTDQRQPTYELNGPSFADYSVGDGSTFTEVFSIYHPGGGGQDPTLSYTTLFQFVRLGYSTNSDNTVVTTVNDLYYGVGGFQTLSSDMPKSGTAVYQGPLRGFYSNGTTLDAVRGQTSLTANFGTGKVDTRLYLESQSLGGSTVIVSGSGPIDTNKFSGSINDGGFTGAFDGSFNGPRAVEAGLSFRLLGADGANIIGVGAGKINNPQ